MGQLRGLYGASCAVDHGAYRVVNLVEADDAGLQTNLVLPGVFPALENTQRSDHCLRSRLRAIRVLAWHAVAASLDRQAKHEVTAVNFVKDGVVLVERVRIL